MSSTELTCKFNLAGVSPGFWSLSVDDGTNSGTLSDVFEIKSYSYASSLAINSPNPFDPKRENTTIMYKLSKDTEVTIVIFSSTGDALWKRNYAANTNGGRSGENSIVWNGITDFSETASNGVFLVHIIESSSGKNLAKGKIAVIRR